MPRLLPQKGQTVSATALVFVSPTISGLHSTALTGKGEILERVLKVYFLHMADGWGRGEHGRLGLGDNDRISKIVPRKVNLIPDKDIIQFCRGDHGRPGYRMNVTLGQFGGLHSLAIVECKVGGYIV
ncbi:hypothetical protein Bca52824_045884 [Brassica carinata]|uniref:Uncharacterized protein n=1 Tax=Brassica carinata TaxID=52824 RepID=A0A8X7RDC3_BRACI|nr:hypothetical protein Bca52824_045884 [Brassica carinata]